MLLTSTGSLVSGQQTLLFPVQLKVVFLVGGPCFHDIDLIVWFGNVWNCEISLFQGSSTLHTYINTVGHQNRIPNHYILNHYAWSLCLFKLCVMQLLLPIKRGSLSKKRRPSRRSWVLPKTLKNRRGFLTTKKNDHNTYLHIDRVTGAHPTISQMKGWFTLKPCRVQIRKRGTNWSSTFAASIFSPAPWLRLVDFFFEYMGGFFCVRTPLENV